MLLLLHLLLSLLWFSLLWFLLLLCFGLRWIKFSVWLFYHSWKPFEILFTNVKFLGYVEYNQKIVAWYLEHK